MTRHAHFGVAALAAVLAADCGVMPGTVTDTDEVDPPIVDQMEAALRRVCAANGVIGAQAAVIVPGEEIWTAAYGRSGDTDPMRVDMAVPVGSTSKTVISGLILRLVDLGTLSLEDTVGAFLPPLDGIAPRVTLRQLLQNTSGIANFNSAPGFITALTDDRDRVWTPEEVISTFVGDPVFEPGTSWQSSNTGYVLAAMIAEAATGQSLADLYAEHVYEPLQLVEMFHPFTEEPRAELAVTWNGLSGGSFVNFTEMYEGPAFATALWPLRLVVSARTLARWGQALFTDFLGPGVRAQMLSAVPDDGRIPNQVGAGVGVRKFNFLGRSQWGHTGTNVSGSSMLLYDEDSGIVIALVYNQPGASHNSSHFTLAPMLLSLALEGG